MSHHPRKTNPGGFFSRYNRTPQLGVRFEEPSLTNQEFRGEADINVLMAKYQQTGLLGPRGVPMVPPSFVDVSQMNCDYHEAMNTVARAEQLFAASPARIRDRFKNDPRALLAFLSDADNRAEAEELGLIEKRPQAAKGAAQEAPPTPPKQGAPPPAPPKTDN